MKQFLDHFPNVHYLGYLTCWQDPAPLDENLSQIVWMSDQAVPSGYYKLLVASGCKSLKMSQSRVVWIPGKLTSLGFT